MNNKIPNEFIKVSATLSHHGNNEIVNILDGDLDTMYASSGKYGAGSYGDIYFTFSNHKAVEGVEFYTSNSRGWGLVQRYEILYKNNLSTAGWTSIYGVTEVEGSEGWRTAQFSPVLAKEICIRVYASHGGFVTVNEAKIYQNLKFDVDMTTLIEEAYGKLSLPDYLDLTLISEVSAEFKGNVEAEKIVDIIKYCYLSKTDLDSVKNGFIRNMSVDIEKFCNRLKIKRTEKLNFLDMFIQGNQNILLISNKDCELFLLEHGDTLVVKDTLKVKSGLNKIYIPNSGELFFIGNSTTDVALKVYGADESSLFKMGESRFPEFMNSQKNRSHIFIESKNFIANLRKEWVENNFNEHDFLDAINTIDTYFDYLYNMVDMSLFYEKNIVKRLLWIGDSSEIAERRDSTIGSYLTFGGDASLFFKKGIHKLVTPLFCKLTSDEIASEEFFSKELADILNLGFFKTFELKYNKRLELTKDIKKDIFIKVLMYSNSDRFMCRLYRNYYSYDFLPEEKPLDRLVLWMSELLFRNIGALFSQKGYTISQEILDNCSKYPNLFMNIDELTSENYKEFKREEVSLFNQNYLNRVQEEERR